MAMCFRDLLIFDRRNVDAAVAVYCGCTDEFKLKLRRRINVVRIRTVDFQIRMSLLPRSYVRLRVQRVLC